MAAVPIQLGPDRAGRLLTADEDAVASCEPPAPAVVLDGKPPPEGVLRPGFVNGHTHIYSALAPFGMPAPEAEPASFIEILERVWWRLDRALDEETLRASARWYVAESLLAGTTTLVDHHESPNLIGGSLDVLADACDELGIRAVLGYGATERNGGRDEAQQGLEECRRFLCSNHRERVRGVVALHASFTVSDETVREAAALCRELDTVMHVHVAEDGADLEDAVARGHAGPLERLMELGALPPGSIIAHGVHLEAGQVQRAADAGIWLVQNPRSNRGNRVGWGASLTASPRVALGTDGYPSRLWEEAQALYSEAAAHGQDRSEVEARTVAGYGLLEELFGAPFAPLDSGAVADVVVMGPSQAQEVVVGGRLVVSEGTLLTGDVEQIRSDAERLSGPLWERMSRL